MIFNFMSDGQVIPLQLPSPSFLSIPHSIPIVYYGQEQGFSGNADPVIQSTRSLFTCHEFNVLQVES